MAIQKITAPKLFATFKGLVHDLDKSLPAKDVHRLRTTARRIEALVNHLPIKFAGKHAHILDEIRTIRKRSGKVRDLDVHLQLLGAVGTEANRSQFEALENRLLANLERRSEKLYKEVRLLQKKKWAARMERLDEAVSNIGTQDLPVDAPLDIARQQLQALSERHPDATSMVDPEELHRLRIEIKKIRYTAELGSRGAAARSFLAAVEKTQDAIGTWHDWLTLSENAEEALNNYVSSGILLELRSRTTSAYSEAIRAVTELFARENTPAKKAPRGVAAKARSVRSA